jgi:hypothetical protein
MTQKSSSLAIILTIILIVTICCLCVSLVIVTSGAVLFSRGDQSQTLPGSMDQPLPNIIPPTITIAPIENVDPTPTLTASNLEETLNKLNKVIVPINDPIELAERLGGKENIPITFPDPDAPYQIGDSKAFWVTNVDNLENFRINATVRYLGENTYFWIENGISYLEEDLLALGDAFDQEIYPTTRAFFGSEWSPGVDQDPRIHILYAGGLGKSLAGYYSSADQLHPDAHEYSNAHEMFLINADNVQLWHASIYSTLAHELQHMIHWHVDKNEDTWLNEGFSMLAELVNGYNPGSFDYLYVQNTDRQLTDWGSEVGENGPHYGAALLFTTYFLDRFGEETTKVLMAEQKNGMESINAIMTDLDIRDPLTGNPITAEEIFADWAVTNVLGDPNVSDGRYHYSIYPDAPLASPNSTITTCPTGPNTNDVAQYGVDYIKIACSGDYTLTFEGSTTTSLLPIDPYSGDFYLWSNMGDHSNMSLERSFDLRDVNGRVEMTYHTWYDLEKDYDYVFISASTDEENWKILTSSSCTTANPSGNSYGCGLNGYSGGWRLEAVDLTPFVGQEVTIRFDYVTDAAVNGDGMVIDDIRVDAIDYFTDFEQDNGGWYGEGFVRIQNHLPQFYQVSMITFGDQIAVTPVRLNENNQASVEITIGGDTDAVVLVVSGTTPYTRQRAVYQVEIK